MQTLRIFDVGDDTYLLCHNVANDSRAVVNIDNETILEIDSSLHFTNEEGAIGDLRSEGDEWVFYESPNRTRIPTGIAVNTATRTYCWDQLMLAEIEVAKRYIEARDRLAWANKMLNTPNLYFTGNPRPKLVDHFADSAGGHCD